MSASKINPSVRNKEYFKQGSIYNSEYFGSNEAHKEQNGQTTFRIDSIGAAGKVVFRDLFDRFPSDRRSENLEAQPTHASLQGLINRQHEYKYTLVEKKEDFFIHSKRMTIKESVEKGLVLKFTIEYVFRDKSKKLFRKSPIVWCNSQPSLTLCCEENVSKNPYLQTIVFAWDSSDEMKKDVRSVYPDAWFSF